MRTGGVPQLKNPHDFFGNLIAVDADVNFPRRFVWTGPNARLLMASAFIGYRSRRHGRGVAAVEARPAEGALSTR